MWTLYNCASADLKIFVKRGANWWLCYHLVMSPVMNEATLLRLLRGLRKVRGPDFHQPAMRSSKPSMENGGGLEKVGTSSGENLIGAWPCPSLFKKFSLFNALSSLVYTGPRITIGGTVVNF